MNKRTILIATASLLCFAGTHVCLAKPTAAGGAASHMQRGIELAEQKNFDGAVAEFTKVIEANPKDPLGAVIAFYFSMGHREGTGDGCPVVALGADAARQGVEVKASFEAGIRRYLEMLGPWVGEPDGDEPSGKAMAILSTMVGALTLSRAVNDPILARAVLNSAVNQVRAAVPRKRSRSRTTQGVQQ